MDSHEQWESNGFVGPIDLALTDHEIAAIRDDFEAWKHSSSAVSAAALVDVGPKKFDCRFKSHLVLPAISHFLVFNPTLIRILQSILDTENILCWSTDWNVKVAGGSGGIYLPHQDSTYAGLAPAEKVVTVWIAISDPVFEQDGCLAFWEGSHKLGQLPHTRRVGNEATESQNLLALNQYCEPPNNKYPTPVPLRVGQATIHSFYTVHASGLNSSNQDRVGFAIRYMAASVRQTGSVRESVTLVSGKLEHDGFDKEPVLSLDPSMEELDRGRLAQQDSLRRESLNYFGNK